jgi:hypothetical protein
LARTLIKKGKSENSDEVQQAKQEIEKSLKLGKKKICARYKRKIRRLKRDFEAKQKADPPSRVANFSIRSVVGILASWLICSKSRFLRQPFRHV